MGESPQGQLQQQQTTTEPQSQLPAPPASQQSTTPATAAATPAPTPTPIVLKSGGIVGLDDQFSPTDSDTAAGGNGQTIDGVACYTSMYTNQYHVHFFLGIMYNKKQIAVPDAIGMYKPGSETSGYTNNAQCYYPLHTHDATGMIHVEANSNASLGSSLYTLGQVLAVWGEPISSTGFGPYSGPVHIYVAHTPLRATYSTAYSAYTGDPHSLALYSHEAIWIEVGSSYYTATQLPAIRFYTEY